MTSKPLIDWAKPIEYVDGSPAVYLGRDRDTNDHMVTPHSFPSLRTGNFYNDKGKHMYGLYMSIRNVSPVAAAIATLKAEGYTVDETAGVISPPGPLEEQREFMRDLYSQVFKCPLPFKAGESDSFVNKFVSFLSKNKHRIPDTFE